MTRSSRPQTTATRFSATARRYPDPVAQQTSTIRVSRQTRDLLAEQARERGVSLAALLGELADQHRRDAIWRSEREATRTDAQEAATIAEQQDWEATLDDGLD